MRAAIVSLTALIGITGCPFHPVGPDEVPPTPRRAVCGNERQERDELCDGADLDGQSCDSLGFGSGTLACAENCLDFDRQGCAAPSGCGDNQRAGVEVCDGSDLGGASCESLGHGPGSLSCQANCGGYALTGCGPLPSCGNDHIEGIERCDGPDFDSLTCRELGFDSGELRCASDCLSIDRSGCVAACVPDCSGRVCGNDPVCGRSCGTCSVGTCSDGQCLIPDGGVPDTGRDAAATDRGGVDSSQDAAAPDQGQPDSGSIDVVYTDAAGQDAAGAFPSWSIQNYCSNWATISCEISQRCNAYVMPPSSIAPCITGERQVCDDYDLPGMVARGEFIYDAADARTCWETLYGASCAAYSDLRVSQPCRDMFIGATPAGSACDIGSLDTCDDSSRCEWSLFSECNHDQCRRYALVNESCADRSCIAGTYCDASDLCRADLAMNASCATSGVGSCQLGLYCVSGGAQASTCQPYRAEGQSCEDNALCSSSLVCVRGQCRDRVMAGEECAGDWQCPVGTGCLMVDLATWSFACAQRRANNEPCRSDEVCLSDYCHRPSTDVAGTCQNLPGLGLPCYDQCSEGTWCPDGTGSTCQLPSALGGPCNILDSECLSGLWCDYGLSQCRTLSSAGQTCTDGATSQCHEDLICDSASQVCWNISGQDGPCDPLDHMTCDGVLFCRSSDSTCQPPKPDGQGCADAVECQSGYCDQTLCKPNPGCAP
ncbi:MAG: Dickkopf N-terminal cysteine-rich domain-containing protein [Pseudomonadota bacterium]